MIQVDVLCTLQDEKEFCDVATFQLDVGGLVDHCTVDFGKSVTTVSLLAADGSWPSSVYHLAARALSRASRSDLASMLTVSDVVRVTVLVGLSGILYDVLQARGDGREVCDPNGPFVEGADTRFQVWRLVRQILERRVGKPQRPQAELGIYRAGQIEYCLISELPEELQLAFGVCHALSPKPFVPEVPDACGVEEMERFLDMLRLGRGYRPLLLNRR